MPVTVRSASAAARRWSSCSALRLRNAAPAGNASGQLAFADRDRPGVGEQRSEHRVLTADDVDDRRPGGQRSSASSSGAEGAGWCVEQRRSLRGRCGLRRSSRAGAGRAVCGSRCRLPLCDTDGPAGAAEASAVRAPARRWPVRLGAAAAGAGAARSAAPERSPLRAARSAPAARRSTDRSPAPPP